MSATYPSNIDPRVVIMDQRILLDFSKQINVEYSFGRKIIEKSETFKEFPIFNKVNYIDSKKDTLPNINLSVKNDSITFVENTDHKIQYVDVFVLKSRKDKPLLIGVTIDDTKNYFRRSKLIQYYTYVYIFGAKLHGDIIDPLINENDLINGMVTFRIDQKKKYNNVEISTLQVGSRFNQHTHTPIKNFQRNKSIVVNKIGDVNARVAIIGSIPSIQNIYIDNIAVYSNQTGKNADVPILMKVTIGKRTHFFVRRTIYERRWREILIGNWKNPRKLEEKLQTINDRLFRSIIVLIHKQTEYKKFTIEDSSPTKPAAPDPTNIKVIQHYCPFIGNDYVYFKHDLSVYKDSGQQRLPSDQYGFGFGTMKAMVVYIFNVAIKTRMSMEGQSSQVLARAALIGPKNQDEDNADDSLDEPEDELPLSYMDTVNDLNVYFYKGPNGLDNVPLMFNYANYWYKPDKIEDYFVEWVFVKELTDAYPGNQDHALLIKKHLDEVNRMLNRINLNFKECNKGSVVTGKSRVPSGRGTSTVSQGGKGVVTDQYDDDIYEVHGIYTDGSKNLTKHKYGIPGPRYLHKSYDASRITVTCKSFVKDKMVTLYTHEPRNGFNIGVTYYRTTELDKSQSKLKVLGADLSRYDSKAPAGGKGRLLDAKGLPVASRLYGNNPSRHGTSKHTIVRSSTVGGGGYDTQNPDYEDPYDIYDSLYDGNYIEGIDTDLDGSEDITAKAVTVYFYNNDRDKNYPLVIEYRLNDQDEYDYFVLKHCGPARR